MEPGLVRLDTSWQSLASAVESETCEAKEAAAAMSTMTRMRCCRIMDLAPVVPNGEVRRVWNGRGIFRPRNRQSIARGFAMSDFIPLYAEKALRTLGLTAELRVARTDVPPTWSNTVGVGRSRMIQYNTGGTARRTGRRGN